MNTSKEQKAASTYPISTENKLINLETPQINSIVTKVLEEIKIYLQEQKPEETVFQQTLEIGQDFRKKQDKVSLKNEINYLTSIGQLADNIENENQIQEIVCKIALDIKEKVLGQNNEQILPNLNMMGKILIHNKKYALAREFLEKAANIKQESYIMINLANTYLLEEKHLEAINILEKLIQINPRNDEAYANIAGAYCESGNYDKAMEYLQVALTLNPNNTLYRSNADHLHKLLSQEILKGSEEFFEKVKAEFGSLEPATINDAVTCLNMAGLYRAKNEAEKALPCALRAVELSPEDPDMIRSLAINYEELYELGKAAENYKQAYLLYKKDSQRKKQAEPCKKKFQQISNYLKTAKN